MNRLAALCAAAAMWGCGGGHKHEHGHHHHGPAAGDHGGAHNGHHHRFTEPEKYAERWDAEARDAWQKPEQVILEVALPKGGKIADLGAGTGYFSVRFAKHDPSATVYAMDIEDAMVEWLGKRRGEDRVPNLTPLKTAPDSLDVPEIVDVVFVCNTYHHISDRVAYFQAAKEKTRQVAIVDFKKDDDGPGPPPAMRLSAETVVGEMEAAGYALAKRVDLPRQYLLIFDVQ